MAVGLSPPQQIRRIEGVSVATAAAEIRYPERDDMVLLHLVEGSSVAAVFTQNKFCAAPVVLAKQNLAKDAPRALLINSGNANAGTGEAGLSNAIESCHLIAQGLNIRPTQVLPFSTGVIGEQLPMDRVSLGCEKLLGGVAVTDNDSDWMSAAEAIMTTDTVAKAVSERVEIDGGQVTITGIAKGSGMICPNMATLLSYVATDIEVDSAVLQEMLVDACGASFNRITVDSDTSTNDALVLVATGQNELPCIDTRDSPNAKEFYKALERVLITLATAIVRDAEGATKFVKVKVLNGRSESDCEAIAYSVAHSPLVKTALFASDPNWGRLLMAVGKAEVNELDVGKIDLSINNLPLISQGQPAKAYTEEQGQAVFSEQEIEIDINLNAGQAAYHVWTSDLSDQYVSINADYRS